MQSISSEIMKHFLRQRTENVKYWKRSERNAIVCLCPLALDHLDLCDVKWIKVVQLRVRWTLSVQTPTKVQMFGWLKDAIT